VNGAPASIRFVGSRFVLPPVSAVLIAVLLTVGAGWRTPAAAASSAPTASSPTSPSVELGVSPDWTTDSVPNFNTRLGHAAALYSQAAGFPFTPAERTYLEQYFEQVSGAGGSALLTLNPRLPLGPIDARVGQAVATEIGSFTARYRVPVLLRFAPEMNAPWQPWGLQPTAYVRGFQAVADAVHSVGPPAGGPPIRMVWAPTYSRGYPFTNPGAQPSISAGDLAALDTDRSGSLDSADDPYGPYYPGDAAVDLVGLPVYHWGSTFPYGANEVPASGEFAGLLSGRGDPVPPRARADRDFYRRFTAQHRKPLVVQTAALYNPASPGPSESAIKQAWWQQVFGPETRRQFPGIAVVELLEVRRAEAAAGGAVIDWRSTSSPELAAGLRSVLDSDGVRVGSAAPRQAAASSVKGHVLRGAAAWTAVGISVAVYLGLLILAISGRVRRWAYPEDQGERDLRIDLLRGLAITFVVLDHVNIASLFQLVSQEAIGPVSGAELFVALAGLVVGIVYRPRLERAGVLSTAPLLLRRAARLYAAALVVVLAAYAASGIPGLDGKIIRTFTEARPGGGGGTTYDLYANIGQFLDYPVPGFVIRSLLLLQMGPSQFNIIGLYVVLLAVTVAVLWLLRRRLVVAVLALSWALYVLNALHPVRLFPSQFEDAFPLLTWQVLFVNGLAAGYYRRSILRWVKQPAGRAAVAAVVVLHAGFLFFTWNNPYLSNRYDARLGLISDDTFGRLYARFFERNVLGLGRLLDVALLIVTLLALLTVYWKPIEKAFGWFLIPMGQATLYVFIMQVFASLLVGSIPALRGENIWLNTAAHAVVLAVLWLMVRRRFLFRVVPR
jgi:hypothetical protein